MDEHIDDHLSNLKSMSNNSWLALENMALDDVHPSWIADIDPALMQMARCSALGRRYLANKLSAKFTLFAQPSCRQETDSMIASEDWLFSSLTAHSDDLLELGAKSCLDILRAEVSREKVLRLRRVLTDGNYERILQQANPDVPKRDRYDDNFDALETDDDLYQRLLCNAAIEIYGYSLKKHPLAAERVLMSFPFKWSLEGAMPRLNLDDTASFLQNKLTANDLGV